jgi:hypothetical protein
MPVASPYALFRASDLIWPALPAAPLKRAAADHLKAAPRAHWPAVIQGELFPLAAGSRSSRPPRSTPRRASP